MKEITLLVKTKGPFFYAGPQAIASLAYIIEPVVIITMMWLTVNSEKKMVGLCENDCPPFKLTISIVRSQKNGRNKEPNVVGPCGLVAKI